MYTPVRRSNGGGCARVQRMFQVLSRLHDERYTKVDSCVNQGDWAGWLTTGQIARSLGMSNSPHLRGILDELYGKGFVLLQTDYWRPNMQVVYWQIASNARYSRQWIKAFDAYLNESFAEKLGEGK